MGRTKNLSYPKNWVSIVGWAGFLAITLLGAFRVGREIASLHGELPSPDVQTYWAIAKQMTHPFQTDHREPVWIWLVKFAGFFADSRHLPESAYDAIRVLGLGTFFVAAQLWFWILLSWSRRWSIALIGYGLFFLNYWLLDLAAGGTRDMGYLLFIKVWLESLLLLVRLPERVSPKLIAVGAVGFALVVGTRINFLSAGFVVYLALAVIRRIDWRMAAGVFVGGLLLTSPFLYLQKIEHGDAFYSVNVHGAWYRNTEFMRVKNQSCIGCPSRQELEKNSYAGTQITAAQWMFGMHTRSEIIAGTLPGYEALLGLSSGYVKLMSGTSSGVLYALFWVGCLVALLLGRAEIWIILLAIPRACFEFG